METIVKSFNELTIEELYEIMRVRVNVFVVEQNCPYPELDGKDINAHHIFIKNNQGIVAYLRVLPPGVSFDVPALGRILTISRGKGYGKQIVTAGINFTLEHYKAKAIKIEAQTYARGFYEKFGFHQCSEEFLEDGIPHIEMIRESNGKLL